MWRRKDNKEKAILKVAWPFYNFVRGIWEGESVGVEV